MHQAARLRRWPVAAVLLLVLLVAAGLRFVRLPDLPIGLHYDEAANGVLAGEIAQGLRAPVFIRSYTGKEVLFFYWASLWMRLAGRSLLALRIAAASAGLLTVAACVWSTYEVLGAGRDAVWAAVLSGAFVAVSFWHVVLSRYGFRAISQPLMQAITVAAMWRGLRLAAPGQAEPSRTKGWVWLGLSGLFLGLTAYTYLAARAFPIPVLVAWVALLAGDPARRRSRLLQCSVVAGIALLALAPLAYFWLANPGTFLNRAQQVAATSWAQVWTGIRACLSMFFLGGDPYIRFNIPGRPLFSPGVALLLCIGVATVAWWCVRWIRQCASSAGEAQPANSLVFAGRLFLLAVIPVMILPSALAAGDVTPSNLRTVGLLPFVYVLPALGLLRLVAIGRRWLPRISVPWLWAVVVLLGSGGATAKAYFRDWAPSAALYYASDGDLVDTAAYLNQTERPAGEAIYVASIHYRHPTLAFLARDYSDLLWLTGGRTVVFPEGMDSLVVIPHSADADREWIERMLAGADQVGLVQAPGGGRALSAYRLPATERPEPSQILSANFANVVELIGYDVIGEPASGGQVDLALWWRVHGVPEHGDLAPVVQLVDSWGSVWGEASPFQYPGEEWAVGDLIVDHLTIPVGLGAPPGSYDVRASMYSAQAREALPVLGGDGRYSGTWVQLPISLDSSASATEINASLEKLAGQLGIRNRTDIAIGDLRLIGADLETTTLRPGEPLWLTLYWRAGEERLPDYSVAILLGGTTVYSGSPVHGTYPFSDWQAGQVVVDRYDPRLPRDLPPGTRALRLRLSESGSTPARVLEVDLGLMNVQEVERSFEASPVAVAHLADLDGKVELVGYELSPQAAQPGGAMVLRLYWRAQAEMDQDYTVFVHMSGSDGWIAGQHDGRPVGGTYPTTLWLSDEFVVDDHEFLIHPNASAGEYWLDVGMYIAETGVRLVDRVSGLDYLRLQPVQVRLP